MNPQRMLRVTRERVDRHFLLQVKKSADINNKNNQLVKVARSVKKQASTIGRSRKTRRSKISLSFL